MSEPLQRLLETEARAQATIDAASRERQRIVDAALAAARAAEARFEADRAELRAPYLAEAHARAEQAVAAFGQAVQLYNVVREWPAEGPAAC